MFTSGETDKEILSVSGFLTGIGSHCRVVLSDFCGEFSSVDGTTIYIGGSDNRQKSVRVTSLRDQGDSDPSKGYWECHINPDWLLLYEKDTEIRIISLYRTGTHADIFGKGKKR